MKASNLLIGGEVTEKIWMAFLAKEGGIESFCEDAVHLRQKVQVHHPAKGFEAATETFYPGELICRKTGCRCGERFLSRPEYVETVGKVTSIVQGCGNRIRLVSMDLVIPKVSRGY